MPQALPPTPGPQDLLSLFFAKRRGERKEKNRQTQQEAKKLLELLGPCSMVQIRKPRPRESKKTQGPWKARAHSEASMGSLQSPLCQRPLSPTVTMATVPCWQGWRASLLGSKAGRKVPPAERKLSCPQATCRPASISPQANGQAPKDSPGCASEVETWLFPLGG